MGQFLVSLMSNDKTGGLLWAIVLSMTTVVFTFTNNYQFTASTILFVKLRAGLSGAIYQKVREK